jgi:hypothetical protein
VKFAAFIAALFLSPAAFAGGTGSGSGLDTVSVSGALVGGGGPGIDNLAPTGVVISPPPPPFTPASLSGITAFWDFNNSSSLSGSGGFISQVADTIAGHNMVQASGPNQPQAGSGGGFNNRNYAIFSSAAFRFMQAASFAVFGSNQFSIACRVTGAVQQNKMVLGRGAIGTSCEFFLGTGNTGQTKIRYEVSDVVNGTILESAGDAYNSTWQTLVVTWDGTTMNMYVNSTTPDANSSNPSPAPVTTTTNLVDMGARDNGSGMSPGNYFTGSIEYVATYNRALNATEIGQLINYGS